MSDTKTASWIAALERARAELEHALSADGHWRGLREGGAPSSQTDRALGHQRALADNPVYRCWEQLNGAIEELRKAQAGPATARRRISLREVLEHIRCDAGPQQPQQEIHPPDAEPPPPSMGGGLGPPSAGQTVNMAPEPEEAAVSFVIREPARAAPVIGRGGEASAPKGPAPSEDAVPGPGAEAEVTIVRRRR